MAGIRKLVSGVKDKAVDAVLHRHHDDDSKQEKKQKKEKKHKDKRDKKEKKDRENEENHSADESATTPKPAAPSSSSSSSAPAPASAPSSSSSSTAAMLKPVAQHNTQLAKPLPPVPAHAKNSDSHIQKMRDDIDTLERIINTKQIPLDRFSPEIGFEFLEGEHDVYQFRIHNLRADLSNPEKLPDLPKAINKLRADLEAKAKEATAKKLELEVAKTQPLVEQSFRDATELADLAQDMQFKRAKPKKPGFFSCCCGDSPTSDDKDDLIAKPKR